ncbi:MAG: hypothetical protein AAGG51_24515 [Cyanobacteria bacterium P01_G01_bin.54]
MDADEEVRLDTIRTALSEKKQKINQQLNDLEKARDNQSLQELVGLLAQNFAEHANGFRQAHDWAIAGVRQIPMPSINASVLYQRVMTGYHPQR